MINITGWSKSVLTSYHVSGAQIQSIKEKIVLSEPKSVLFDLRPRLRQPKPLPRGSFQPPRYFAKGKEPKNVPEPIRYLLTESLELETARPVPQSASLIRSLCKGKGLLLKNENGLVFLNIDNRFINTLQPYLRAHALIKPPYFNIYGTLQGAHIPVISKREANFNYLNVFRELGTEYTFEIEGLYSLKPDTWPEMEEVWFLKVQSPELEALRRKYFLPSLPSGHSFHIVVAVKPRERAKERPVPFMRINPAFFVA